MYCNFFGLQRRPFDDRPEPLLFCATPRHEEVLAAMEYDAQHGTGVTLVVGEAGTGKTMLLRVLQGRLSGSHRMALVSCPISREFDILRAVSRQFGVAKSANARGSTRLLARIKRGLAASGDGDGRSVLLVDQAENLGQTAVRRLAALSGMGDFQDASLQVIIACQPRFREVLQRPELVSLRQRAFDVRTLEALDEHDTAFYVAKRMELAGAGSRSIFEPGAIRTIHEAAGGIPRLINRLCDATLVAAYGMGRPTISIEIAIEVASRTLDSAGAGHPARSSQPEMLVEVHAARPPFLENEQMNTGPYSETPAAFADVEIEQPEHAFAGSPWGGTAEPRPSGSGFSSRTGHGTKAPRHEYGSASPRPAFRSISERDDGASSDGPGTRALLERLERSIRRAERLDDIRARWDAGVDQMEQRLEDRMVAGESMIQSISQAVLRMEKAAQTADQRSRLAVEEWDQRLAAFERRLEDLMAKAAPLLDRLDGLDRSCERASDIEERLTTFGARLVEAGESAQGKISLLMQGLTTGEAVLDRLGGVASQAEELLARSEGQRREQAAFVEGMEARCAAAGARTRSELEQIQTRTDEAAARLHDLLEKGEAAHASTAELTARTRAVEGSVERCRAGLEDVESRGGAVRQSVAELRDGSDAARAAAAEAQRQLETATDQHQALSRAMTDQINRLDNAQRRANELTATVDGVAAKIDELELGAAQTTGQLDDLLQSTQIKVNDLCARGREQTGDLAGLIKRAEGCMADVRESIGQVETAHHTVANCLINIGSACERVDAARRDVARVSTALDELGRAGSQCEALEERFAAMLKQADGLEAMMRRVSEARQLMTDLDLGRRRLDQASRSAEEAERLCRARMDEAQQACEETRLRLVEVSIRAREDLKAVEELAPTLDQARQLSEALTLESGQAGRRLEALGSHVAAASDVIRNLAAATQESHAIVQRIDAAAEKLSVLEPWAQRVDEARPAAAQLEDLLKSAAQRTVELEEVEQRVAGAGEDAAARLDERLGAARSAGDEIQHITRHAAEMIIQAKSLATQLGAAVDSSTATLNRLDEATRSATDHSQELGEKLAEAERHAAGLEEAFKRVESIQHTRGQVERLLADAVELCNAAQTRADRLEAVHRTGQPLLQQLNGAVADARSAAASLEDGSLRCRAGLAAFQDERRKVEGAGRRCKRIIAVLRGARRAEESLARSTQEADGACRRASETSAELAECREALRREHDAARQTLEEQATARAEAASILEQIARVTTAGRELADHLTDLRNQGTTLAADLEQRNGAGATLVERSDDLLRRVMEREDALAAGERMLREFMAQAQIMAERIQKLHVDLEGVDEEVGRITTEPARIVEDARRQAEQLEAVCKAIRKVFAALSKTGLEANQKTAEFASMSREAETRIQRLLAETQGSAASLREWVDEAIRAQTRLARMLEKAPAIRQTHPVPDLADGPGLISARVASLATLNAAPEHGSPPQALAAAFDHNSTALTRPRTRADEIDALLRDVHRGRPRSSAPAT